jgi:hypothetical protein
MLLVTKTEAWKNRFCKDFKGKFKEMVNFQEGAEFGSLLTGIEEMIKPTEERPKWLLERRREREAVVWTVIHYSTTVRAMQVKDHTGKTM